MQTTVPNYRTQSIGQRHHLYNTNFIDWITQPNRLTQLAHDKLTPTNKLLNSHTKSNGHNFASTMITH